jgi:hypothetical protein
MESARKRETPPLFAYVTIFVLGLLTAAGYETLRDAAVGWNQREVVRVTSPDGEIDAVFVEPIVHAFQQESALYFVQKGEPAPSRGPQLKGHDFKEQPGLVWKRSHLLTINYGQGCIRNFANLWHSYDVENGHYYVELALDPTTDFPCSAGPTAARSAVR